MEDLTKLLTRRSSLGARKAFPYSNLNEKITRAIMVLNQIENTTTGRSRREIRIKSEARRQHVISLVTAFEVYLGDLVRELIDSGKINNMKKITENLGRKYTVAEIDYIIKNKISTGELICDQISFQNLSRIFSFLGNLFETDFSELIHKHKFQYVNMSGNTITLSVRKGFEKKLSDLISLRHSFVHEITFNNTPSYADLSGYGTLIRKLAVCIDVRADGLRGVTSSKIVRK